MKKLKAAGYWAAMLGICTACAVCVRAAFTEPLWSWGAAYLAAMAGAWWSNREGGR